MDIEDNHSISLLCKIAGVSQSAYRRYKRQPLRDESELKSKIYDLYIKSGKRAGYRMIKYLLFNDYHLTINHKKVLRLMQEMGIASIIRKKYKSASGRGNLKSNILNREFNSDKPMKKLVTDITYIHCRDKTIYLSTVIDLFNNEPVQWVVSDRQNKAIAINTIKKLSQKYDLRGSIIHSDQGMQYRSHEYVELLEELEITQSMSRPGNCWDNAKVESFFSHFKTEAIRPRKVLYKNLDEAKKLINEYMEYYIHRRPQRKLKGLSPYIYKQRVMAQ